MGNKASSSKENKATRASMFSSEKNKSENNKNKLNYFSQLISKKNNSATTPNNAITTTGTNSITEISTKTPETSFAEKIITTGIKLQERDDKPFVKADLLIILFGKNPQKYKYLLQDSSSVTVKDLYRMIRNENLDIENYFNIEVDKRGNIQLSEITNTLLNSKNANNNFIEFNNQQQKLTYTTTSTALVRL
jgi:hypothetical protein